MKGSYLIYQRKYCFKEWYFWSALGYLSGLCLLKSSENAFKHGECYFKYAISVSGYKAVPYGKMLIIWEVIAEFLQNSHKAFRVWKSNGKAVVKQVISVLQECAYLPIYQIWKYCRMFFTAIWTLSQIILALLPELSSSGFLILRGITGFTTLPFLPEHWGQFDWLLFNSQFHSEFSFKFFVWVQHCCSELLIPPWAICLAMKKGVRI